MYDTFTTLKLENNYILFEYNVALIKANKNYNLKSSNVIFILVYVYVYYT